MNKKEVTRNQYELIQKEASSVYWKKCLSIKDGTSNDEIKRLKSLYYKEFEAELDKYDVLDFVVNTEDEDIKKFVNKYFDTEDIKSNSVKYRGHGVVNIIYDFINKKGFKIIYQDCYSVCAYNKDLLTIVTYCEGDIICEVFNDKESMINAVKDTEEFYKENY